MNLRPLADLVCPIDSWNPARSDPDETFRYIDLSAVDQESKSIVAAREVRCGEAPSRARQLVEAGDVLVSTVRPNLNGVAKVPGELSGATASTGFCVLRPKSRLLDNDYLSHWVKAPKFISEMVRQATGASYPAVSDRIVLSSSIPLPPLPEQRRTATILDHAEALLAKRQKASAQLDSIVKSTFVQMFGDPGANPKDIQKVPLGEVMRLKSGDFLPAADMSEGGSYPVFGGNGVSGYHDSYMFEERQIVVGRVGVYCGCVHIAPAKSWVTDNALYVSKLDSRIHFDFLAYSLRLARLNQYASQSAQPLVSGGRIYPVKILLPPMKQQMEFVSRQGAMGRLREIHEQSAIGLTKLFASIQDRAFRGEL